LGRGRVGRQQAVTAFGLTVPDTLAVRSARHQHWELVHVEIVGRALLAIDAGREARDGGAQPLGEVVERQAGFAQERQQRAGKDRVRIAVTVGQAVKRELTGPAAVCCSQSLVLT